MNSRFAVSVKVVRLRSTGIKSHKKYRAAIRCAKGLLLFSVFDEADTIAIIAAEIPKFVDTVALKD